jgi:hypothetical protein
MTIATPPMAIDLLKPDSSISLKGLPASSKKGNELQPLSHLSNKST